MKRIICTIAVCLAVMASAVISAQQDNASQFGVQHRLISVSKVTDPTPPPDVVKSHRNSIGNGRVTVNTAQPGSFWQQTTAVGGSIHAELTTDYLYDSSLGIVYAYRNGEDFTCKNGQTESHPVLEARYTKGNKAGKPVGSGWYAVDLRANKCGATEAGVYGCKLDSTATATQCGMATVNGQTGDLDLATAQ